jgi:hypothetical protein
MPSLAGFAGALDLSDRLLGLDFQRMSHDLSSWIDLGIMANHRQQFSIAPTFTVGSPST